MANQKIWDGNQWIQTSVGKQEFDNLIGNVPLETTAQTVIPAINEINTGLNETATQLAQIVEDVAEIPTIIDESLGGAKIRNNNGVLETLVGSVWIPILKEGDVMPILTNVVTGFRACPANETSFTKVLDIQGKKGKLRSVSISNSTSQVNVRIVVDGESLLFVTNTGAKVSDVAIAHVQNSNLAQQPYGANSTFTGLFEAGFEFKESLEVFIRNANPSGAANVSILAQTE